MTALLAFPSSTSCSGGALGYWSATTYASGPGGAWWVFFSNGDVGTSGKISNFYVRAVRSGL
ncbi:MAG: DUF1566 domain-containing protein [Candidatus Binatia bacterium]